MKRNIIKFNLIFNNSCGYILRNEAAQPPFLRILLLFFIAKRVSKSGVKSYIKQFD